ncbi:hypothetical protein N665_0066s0063 [Sinapis alba]|nr:hypothetical protein N665_0066s0063 [Sinapis alba]
MASSSLTTPLMKEDVEGIDWAELPYELTSSILSRLCAVDILENVQKVCTSWRSVCKDPAMWRKIDMRNSGDLVLNLEAMCRHAVDRSQGGLVEIVIWNFGTDSLLNYIADRCSERIKVLRRPNDSTHDYPYDIYIDSFEDDPSDYLADCLAGASEEDDN